VFCSYGILRQRRRETVFKKEKLEADFKMYKEAIEDLERHGGDKKAIQKLKAELERVGKVLNMLDKSNVKEKLCASFV
jgi:chaperonin cofactor prefoldin